MNIKLILFLLSTLTFISCTKESINNTSYYRTIHVPEEFPTINAAIQSAKANDTIVIGRGTYNESVFIDKNIFLTSKLLNSQDFEDVKNTIIQGDNELQHGIYVAENLTSVFINGLTIQSFNDGIYPLSKTSITNNIIKNNRDGIDYEKGSGGILVNNYLFNNRDDGVDLDDNVTLAIFENYIYDNLDDGIEMRFQPNYAKDTVLISKNLITGNKEDGIQFISYNTNTLRHITISENLIVDNEMAGIGFMGSENTIENYEAFEPSERFLIFNNTIMTNAVGISGGGIETYIINNILSDNSLNQIKSTTTENIKYNIIDGIFFDEINTTVNILQSPKLDFDYSPKVNSVAINNGVDRFEMNDSEIYNIEIESCDSILDIGWRQFNFKNDCF